MGDVIAVILNEFQLLQSVGGGVPARVDYDTFHRAVEAVTQPETAQQSRRNSLAISVGGSVQSASDVMQRTDFDLGLEFGDDDPSMRAAKRDVYRKVRKQLQMHLTKPRQAFLTVDKNRDGLLTAQELRS